MKAHSIALVALLIGGAVLAVRNDFLARQRASLTTLNLLKDANDAQLCTRDPSSFAEFFRSHHNPDDPSGICLLLVAWQASACYTQDVGQALLEQVPTCPQEQVVAAAGGQRAWEHDDVDLALSYWSELPPEILLNWGAAMLMTKDYESMALQLLALAKEAETTFAVEERFQLNAALGDYYRQASMWSKAIPFYEVAWSLFPERGRIAEYLGRSYNRAGRYGESAAVLEQGLANLPPGAERPILVANYYIDLGTSQAALGNHGRACFAYANARATLKEGAALVTAEQARQIGERVARLGDDVECFGDG